MKRSFSRKPNRDSSGVQRTPALREFVYLDEVSLRSLLSSQTGGLTDEVTDLISQAFESEVGGTASANSFVAKAELTSRLQATDLSSSQISRKSIVQSLFKEFRELMESRLVLRPRASIERPLPEDQLFADFQHLLLDSKQLTRGSIIEIEVELAADPIFRFSTVISELGELADDYPAMLEVSGTASIMAEAMPINRVLRKMLAGLVPIRATATGLVLVERNGNKFVVPKDAIDDPNSSSLPLEIVGVTEESGYWKDPRRVLYSGARFTMLCRISRDNLQETWSPIKLADVLAEIAPGFPAALEKVGTTKYAAPIDQRRVAHEATFLAALDAYESLLYDEANVVRDEDACAASQAYFETLVTNALDATSQKIAFRSTATRAATIIPSGVGEEERDAELRSRARELAGLDLFFRPSSLSELKSTPTVPIANNGVLLDTEIIAIYW
jgi:hypothetical protein